MADQRIHATENMIGANHPSLTDTLNRLSLVSHGIDGTHLFTTDSTDSVSTSTGAITTLGGVGIGKSLSVGGAGTFSDNLLLGKGKYVLFNAASVGVGCDATTGDLASYAAGVAQMTISASTGKVFIGSTVDNGSGAKLQVNGPINWTGYNASGIPGKLNSGIVNTNNSTFAYGMTTDAGGGLHIAANQSLQPIVFYCGVYTTPSERMRITGLGNLLIGTSTDDGINKVQVSGNMSVTNIYANFIKVGTTDRLSEVKTGVISDGSQYYVGTLFNHQGSIVITDQFGFNSTIPFWYTGYYKVTLILSTGLQLVTNGYWNHTGTVGNSYVLYIEDLTGNLYIQKSTGSYTYSVKILYA